MKKSILINSEISYIVAKMGHGDSLVIADSGLPIADNVKRIDLAVKKDIPAFTDVLKAVLSEQCVEEVVLAFELKDKSPKIHTEIINILNHYEKKEHLKLKITEISHEDFKKETQKAKAIIRTGEFTPYANIILKSGVVF